MGQGIAGKIAIGLLAFAALTLAINSFRYFLSELHSFQGKRYERYWESQGSIASTEQWLRARQHMERSHGFNDQNPATLLRLARILEWYIFTPAPDGDTIRSNLEQAADAIDQALLLRPDDGFALSARAQLKSRRWQIDESLSADIETGWELAPWERPVYRRLMYAGLVAWPAMDLEGRETLVRAFIAAAEYRPEWARQMLLVASEYGRLNALCDALSGLDFIDTRNVREKQCPRVD